MVSEFAPQFNQPIEQPENGGVDYSISEKMAKVAENPDINAQIQVLKENLADKNRKMTGAELVTEIAKVVATAKHKLEQAK